MCLERTKRNDNFIFSPWPFPNYFGLKWCHNSIFLIFFAFSLAFSIPRRVGTEQTDNFYFLSFSFFSKLFWLKIKPKCVFLIFWIFLLFCWNFQLRVGQEWNGTIIFIFTLSRPFPTYFGLKWSHNGFFFKFWIFWLFFGILY